MEKSNTKTVINILYEKSDNFFEFYATGIYGGIGPHGELNMYFFEDSTSVPESETIEIAQDGRANVINQSDSNSIIRIIKCKATMDPNDIPSLIDWLKEKYDQHKEAKRGVLK